MNHALRAQQTERRRALLFAMSELDAARVLIEEMAPATDNPEYMLWKARALRFAIATLRKPHFPVSPLI